MIDDYSFGRIVIDGKAYTSDVIIYLDRVDDTWWRQEGHALQLEDLEDVFAAEPEILVVGQGKPGLMKVSKETREAIARRGIELLVSPTPAACSHYNKLVAKGRNVVAAFHLTC